MISKRMLSARWSKRLLFALVLSISAGAVHCGSSHDPIGDVIYAGDATDEAYLAIVDALPRAVTGGSTAPVILTPTQGQVLSRGSAPTFSWNALAALPSLRRNIASAYRADFVQITRRALPQEGIQLFEQRVAEAHLPPITGEVFLLRFSNQQGDLLAEVFTTQLQYTPDAAVLSRLTNESGTLSLRIVSGYLRSNVVTEGPYQMEAARQFSFAAAQ